MNVQDASSPAAVPTEIAEGSTRRRAFLVLTLVFLGIAAAYAAYWFLIARWQESTDDAYVAGHVVQITPQVGGTVKTVFVDDTDIVAANEILVELDDADSRVALEQAEAALAQTVRDVRALYIRNDALRAEVATRQSEVNRLSLDFSRRVAVVQSGAISREDFDHAREALQAARSALTVAREQMTANRALTDGTETASHPAVQQAAARVEDAWLAWSRSRIIAPVAGQVAKRNVQIGQRVAAGTPLMAVVPLDQLWVEANFKEVQLGKMRVGHPVIMTADYYGAAVRYHGRVTGFAAGTGSAFALLPAQNATGNWIKVVQRVPVRVELDAAELKAHPLRIGLSMQVTVDIRGNGDKDIALNDAERPAMTSQTSSDDALDKARLRIAEIIRQHDTGRGKE
jgi:membrane fusion protein (multidrug efflux system)